MSIYSKLRVAFLGNCQAAGIVPSLRALLPDAVVDGWNVNNDLTLREAIRERLGTGYDVIIAHFRDSDEMFDQSWLSERCTRTVFMNPIIFTGFHPDVVALHHHGAGVSGPMHVQHSAIIAAAYSIGLDQERVPTLFNSLIYSKLGYFDAFTAAKEAFLQQHRDAGYNLAEHFDKWLGAGAFMYTLNHPRIDVLSTMATLAAARAGLAEADNASPIGVIDDLAGDIRWPVFPEIARRIGVAGETRFCCDASQADPGGQREINLSELVRRFYRVYSALPDLTFDTPGIVTARDRLRAVLS